MINLNSEIDIGDFFRWWGHELSSFLPQKIRDTFSHDNGQLVIEIDTFSNTAKVSYSNDKQEEVLLEELEINALAKQEIQNLIESDQRYKEADCVLRVPAELATKQDVFLPAAAEADLRQAITYELDRYTPFNKDQIYFDTIKIEQEKNKAQLHLILLLVKKTTLDDMYSACLNLGLKPSFSDSSAEKTSSTKKYNLLPEQLRQKADRTPLFVLISTIAITLALFFIMLFYPLYNLDLGLDKLKQRSQLAARDAAIIENSKKGVDYLYLSTEQIIAKKNEIPAMINVIDVVSKVFKDDTWVSHLRFINKTLQLTGQSSSASSLIASLEETKIFHNTKFISPVTKDKRTGMERFKISTEMITNISHADAE